MDIKNIGTLAVTIKRFDDGTNITINPDDVVTLDVGTANYLLGYYAEDSSDPPLIAQFQDVT